MTQKSLFTYFKEYLTINYANFQGRARRREYWGVMLYGFIFGLVIALLIRLLFGDGTTGIIIGNLIYLAILVPNLALNIRRLHDLNKSGWWLVGLLIPLFNIYVAIIMLFVAGTEGDNEYGPDPKATPTEVE